MMIRKSQSLINMRKLNIFLIFLPFVNICEAEDVPVHFWLFTKDNLDAYEDMVFDGENINLNSNTVFDASKPTKLVVHGWGGGTHIDEIFARAYATAGLDYNIIGVDWRDLEGPPQEQVVIVGVYAAHFLQTLGLDYNLRIEDVHPIGWSYGAHVVGNTVILSIIYD